MRRLLANGVAAEPGAFDERGIRHCLGGLARVLISGGALHCDLDKFRHAFAVFDDHAGKAARWHGIRYPYAMSDRSEVECWLTDMDGVLMHEGIPVPGASAFIKRLRESGKPFLVLTNNSIYTPRDLHARLSRIGDKAWRHVVLAHNQIMRRELDRFRGREMATTGDGFLALFDGAARA